MTRTVVLLGDSISAGYGLRAEDALPVQLERALRALGQDVRVVGAGVSGDTIADGARRADRAAPQGTDLCIVALGANDLMQARAPDRVRSDLDHLVGRLSARAVPVLVCGMRAPPWVGAYAAAFDAVFGEVARRHGAAFHPFLLEGVALVPTLNLPDRIHPNAAGIRRIAAHLAPVVAAALRRPDDGGL